MPAPEQLALPFTLDPEVLRTFLARWCALEDEEARLREEKRLLRATYTEHLPLRAVLTAVKVHRARRLLAEHIKEPLSLVHQGMVEEVVATHLLALDEERRQIPDLLGEG